FQAEDGIRDPLVTGVQTCALPISSTSSIKLGWLMNTVLKFSTRSPATSPYSRATLVKYSSGLLLSGPSDHRLSPWEGPAGNLLQIGRASCRERGEGWVVGEWFGEW